MPFSPTESTFFFFISVLMSSAVIVNAFYQKQQFYPSVVYITKSSPSLGIIYIQGLVFLLLFGKLISRIFFGQLRTAEIEHLIERSWYAVTETCLAFTVFRDDLSPKFVALFTLLLFLKCFHWLGEDRVDYMERSPNISMFFHIRIISLLSIFGFLDMIFVYFAYHSTLSKGASVQLVFGFEYAILFAVIINISMKYILHFFDLYNENSWEDKAIYLLYTELIMGFLKISLYFVFIIIMMKIHTFPLFAIRPLYLTMRGFKKALNDVIMSRRAIRNMNSFYPDATTQDIENSDNVCIICRENMLGNGTCKKLPCNHIFHISCLRSWFQRQQTCPTCRMDILRVATTTNTPVGAPVAAQNQVDPNGNNNQQNNNNNAQVPPVPPAPPMMPLFFAPPNALLLQQIQQHLQRQQPQQNNQTTNTPKNLEPSAGSSSQSTPNANLISATIFPHLQTPPFMMPQIPVETLLQGFSEQELRHLEGQSRQQLEARLKCLMDVKTLITAATIRLQQYNCAMLNASVSQTVATQTEPEFFETVAANVGDVPSLSSLSNNQLSDSEIQERLIRQRRLEKFSSSTASTATLDLNNSDNKDASKN